MEETVGNLFLNYVKLAVAFALFQHLATTHDGAEVVFEQLVDLAGDDFVGLVVVSTALAMTHDAVVQLHRLQHGGRHLAGVGTALLVADILGTYGKVGVVAIVGCHFQKGERRTDDNLRVTVEGGFFEFVHDVGDKLVGLVKGLVHFPVSCNNVFSHSRCFFIVNNVIILAC